MRKISLARQVGTQLIFLVVGLFVSIPIWGMVRLAFDGAIERTPTEFRLLPKTWSFDSFLQVLDKPYQSVDFQTLLNNSMMVSFGSALIAVILGLSLAYAFARFQFPGRKTGLFAVLLTAIMPPVAFMTPLYIIMGLLQLRSTMISLVIAYSTFAMPFCIWNMRVAFQAIPKELEEAALLDGAGDFKTFLLISFPLALPSIAVSGLIAFLMAYSEFALGWLFVDKAKDVTLAMSIYVMVRQSSVQQAWNHLGSLAIIMSIPVAVIFLILQRTLLERMMFGPVND